MAARLRNADPEVLKDHPNVLVGSAEEIVERLRSRRERIGVNYVTIRQDQLDSFAPICARMRGT
jgi:hypothetical protein